MRERGGEREEGNGDRSTGISNQASQRENDASLDPLHPARRQCTVTIIAAACGKGLDLQFFFFVLELRPLLSVAERCCHVDTCLCRPLPRAGTAAVGPSDPWESRIGASNL